DAGMRELLAQYIKEQGTIRPRTDQSWKILPLWVTDSSRPDFERLVRRGVWTEDEAKRIDPAAPLTRGEYAAWLGRAYVKPTRGIKPGSADVPPEQSDAGARAEAAGALTTVKGELLGPTEPIDLLSAVEWTVVADHGPFSRAPGARPTEAPDPDLFRPAA